MITICDSGPFMHLAEVNQFYLLKDFFQELEINQVVYDEVVTEGRGRAGEKEFKQALRQGWVKLVRIQDQSLIAKIVEEDISLKDASVIAIALERKADFLISDDPHIRNTGAKKGLRIVGTVGVLTNAKLLGIIPNLKDLLDKLIEQGFHLDPEGLVYQDALKRAGEL